MALPTSPHPAAPAPSSFPPLDPTALLTIAVTGGLGHVGSSFSAHALAQGHAVLALDIHPVSSAPAPVNPLPAESTDAKRYRYAQLDAADFARFKAEVQEGVGGRRCDAVVHLAAVFNKHDDEGVFSTDQPQWRVHNANVVMSWNALNVAADLGIDRVALASSVNAIGMVFSKRPRFDYLPVDEAHPYYPEDAYSISKQICEVQSSAFARRFPSMRIATLRFHWVAPDAQCTSAILSSKAGSWKDLWSYVPASANARCILAALTAPESTFPRGHEPFFVATEHIQAGRPTAELVRDKYPELVRYVQGKEEYEKENRALISCDKARRMLGWREEGIVWRAEGSE